MTDFILRNSSPADLTEYVARQLATFFPDGHSASAKVLDSHMRIALERLRSCFAGIQKPKFRDGPHILFNYMHPDHYAVLLYLLANTIVQHDRDDPLAFRVYYLNKALHGLDVYPAVKLPEVFQFMHPLGTVLGHAEYGNYFSVYQGCSVGSGEDGACPVIGECVVLYAGACVIGRSRIGNNVVLGANSKVIDTDIPDHRVLVSEKNYQIRVNSKHVMDRRFR